MAYKIESIHFDQWENCVNRNSSQRCPLIGTAKNLRCAQESPTKDGASTQGKNILQNAHLEVKSKSTDRIEGDCRRDVGSLRCGTIGFRIVRTSR